MSLRFSSLRASIYIALFLASLPWTSESWTSNAQLKIFRTVQETQMRRSLPSGRSFSLRAQEGPFFGPEEEFECPEEDECEIDWDAMPGFEDDEVEDRAEKEVMAHDASPLESLEKQRVRYEMNWQIEECKDDEDLCEDFCPDCAGSGKMTCRFCRGTGFIVFGDEFRPCKICKDGLEDCSTCRGTGHIAPWVTTMEQHLNASKTI